MCYVSRTASPSGLYVTLWFLLLGPICNPSVVEIPQYKQTLETRYKATTENTT